MISVTSSLGGADGYRPGHRLDVEDVAGPAVGGGGADPQAAALADGEGVGAVVPAEDGAGGRRSGRGPGRGAWPGRPGVAVGDEADVVAVRLVGHGQAAGGRFGADLGLGGVAEGEQGVGQLVGGEHGQDVGLVLAGIGGPVQHAVLDPGVVAGAHGVEAQGQGAVQDRGELDLLVAAQDGLGVAARGVFGDEILTMLR